MLTVHDYPIVPGPNLIYPSAGAQWIRVGSLRGRGRIWAVESTDYVDAARPRRLLCVATGEEIPAGGPIKYVGSFDLLDSGSFHVFEAYT